MSKQEHDHAAAEGGFWISSEGRSYPVREHCGHWDAASALRGAGGSPAALDAGWVRITYCAAGEFACEWYASASVAALRTLAAIVREVGATGYHGVFRADYLPFQNHEAARNWRQAHDWARPPRDRDAYWQTSNDPQAADKLARYVMGHALKKAAAEKAKEPERVLEAA